MATKIPVRPPAATNKDNSHKKHEKAQKTAISRGSLVLNYGHHLIPQNKKRTTDYTDKHRYLRAKATWWDCSLK